MSLRYTSLSGYISNQSRAKHSTFARVPVPKSAPDKVLIYIKYTGVCHTDLHGKTPASLRQREVINNE
ncbi:hypothetical protein B9Z19DRAFT_1093413 [Tuber borchii]|uniref:Uncharacterized protein n=1 Tax=Tuber borchii TaxID=42251 RepID=A0A2T6ZFD0_TUBBO|nr:hypothetical protein B9Z19DRAFT_1093413 [Tuber borchii]